MRSLFVENELGAQPVAFFGSMSLELGHEHFFARLLALVDQPPAASRARRMRDIAPRDLAEAMREHADLVHFSVGGDRDFDAVAVKERLSLARRDECVLVLPVFECQKSEALAILVDAGLESDQLTATAATATFGLRWLGRRPRAGRATTSLSGLGR